MTCPSLYRPVAVADLAGDLAALVRSDSGLGQFSRFVLVGGLSSTVYGVLFVLLRGLGEVPANLIGAALSSVLANELHRRLTFRAGERVGWATGAPALVGEGLSWRQMRLRALGATALDLGRRPEPRSEAA